MRDDPEILKSFVGLPATTEVAATTHQRLTSQDGRLATQLLNHVRAFDAAGEAVPYFGPYRLAHTEGHYQLRNSVCLAYLGLYSQAFVTLRSVGELSLVQAALPEGFPDSDGPFNVVRLLGDEAHQNPNRVAATLHEWAVDGCRTPRWRDMLTRLQESPQFVGFDQETHLADRLTEFFSTVDSYVHARGYLRSATSLSSGNMIRFSAESLSQFSTRLMSACQLSVSTLLATFLPSATRCENAAAGFIDIYDLLTALEILPEDDAAFLQQLYDNRPE